MRAFTPEEREALIRNSPDPRATLNAVKQKQETIIRYRKPSQDLQQFSIVWFRGGNKANPLHSFYMYSCGHACGNPYAERCCSCDKAIGRQYCEICPLGQ